MSLVGIASYLGFKSASVSAELPRIVSAGALSNIVVRVAFDQKMKRVSASGPNDTLNPANWEVVNIGGGVAVSVSSVSLYQADPTTVDLLLSGEMTGGSQYEARSSNLESDNDLPLNILFEDYEFTGFGIAPRVSSAVASLGKVRVTFDSAMTDAGLTTPGNYQFTGPTSLSAVSVSKVASAIVDVLFSEEMRDSETYAVEVSGVSDLALNPIDPAHDSASFAGVGESPSLSSVVSGSISAVIVTFNEEVDQATAEDKTNYALKVLGGLSISVLAAVKVTATQYDLTTQDQESGTTYLLTVTGVEDLAGNVISPPGNEKTFTFEPAEPEPEWQRLLRVRPKDGSYSYADSAKKRRSGPSFAAGVVIEEKKK